jgi:hypothetical protein
MKYEMTQLRFIILIQLAVLFYSLTSFAQPSWERIDFDENIHFLIPLDYEKSHDVGQNSFAAFSEFGYIQVDKSPPPLSEIFNKEHLNKCYQVFQKSVVESNYGVFATDSTYKLNELYVHSFQFENYRLATTQLHSHMIVLLDGYIYSFSYRTLKRHNTKTRSEMASFFGSISFHNKGFEDQLTLPKGNDPLAVIVGLVIRYVMIGALAIAVVLFYFKKHKLVRIIKNIFSWAFLVWGAVCAFLYLGNLVFSVHMPSMLIVGIVCLIVGFLLRLLKLPNG